MSSLNLGLLQVTCISKLLAGSPLAHGVRLPCLGAGLIVVWSMILSTLTLTGKRLFPRPMVEMGLELVQ